jgi:hypothetical protein
MRRRGHRDAPVICLNSARAAEGGGEGGVCCNIWRMGLIIDSDVNTQQHRPALGPLPSATYVLSKFQLVCQPCSTNGGSETV